MNEEIYKIVNHTNFMYYYYLISIIIDDFRHGKVYNRNFYTIIVASITKTCAHSSLRLKLQTNY